MPGRWRSEKRRRIANPGRGTASFHRRPKRGKSSIPMRFRNLSTRPLFEPKTGAMWRSTPFSSRFPALTSRGLNSRGAIRVSEGEIGPEDLDEVRKKARNVRIPRDNGFVHSIIHHYSVDGQDKIVNPLGMMGTQLEADCHIVHGMKTRIQKFDSLRSGSPPGSRRNCFFTRFLGSNRPRQRIQRGRFHSFGHRRRHHRLHLFCRRSSCCEWFRRGRAANISPTIFPWF